ncbi:MAG: hypothetical protein Q9208_004057 [Pyrenodesmia sp. 3 TL-2023]
MSVPVSVIFKRGSISPSGGDRISIKSKTFEYTFYVVEWVGYLAGHLRDFYLKEKARIHKDLGFLEDLRSQLKKRMLTEEEPKDFANVTWREKTEKLISGIADWLGELEAIKLKFAGDYTELGIEYPEASSDSE